MIRLVVAAVLTVSAISAGFLMASTAPAEAGCSYTMNSGKARWSC